MAIIRIKDLRLRAIIGANDWERDHKQDILINISFHFDASSSVKSDNLSDTVDYKTITKNIISHVETSEFFLIEKLADTVLDIVLKHPLISEAEVKIDKPFALRFADSVSIELRKKK